MGWWNDRMAFSDLQRERNGSSLRQNYFIILSLKEAQQFRLQNKSERDPSVYSSSLNSCFPRLSLHWPNLTLKREKWKPTIKVNVFPLKFLTKEKKRIAFSQNVITA